MQSLTVTLQQQSYNVYFPRIFNKAENLLNALFKLKVLSGDVSEWVTLLNEDPLKTLLLICIRLREEIASESDTQHAQELLEQHKFLMELISFEADGKDPEKLIKAIENDLDEDLLYSVVSEASPVELIERGENLAERISLHAQIYREHLFETNEDNSLKFQQTTEAVDQLTSDVTKDIEEMQLTGEEASQLSQEITKTLRDHQTQLKDVIDVSNKAKE